jgi:hypothetical protein
MRVFRSGPMGCGLDLSRSKPAVLESFPRNNVRAESTRLSLCVQGMNNGSSTAAAVNLANFVQAAVGEKGWFRG